MAVTEAGPEFQPVEGKDSVSDGSGYVRAESPVFQLHNLAIVDASFIASALQTSLPKGYQRVSRARVQGAKASLRALRHP